MRTVFCNLNPIYRILPSLAILMMVMCAGPAFAAEQYSGTVEKLVKTGTFLTEKNHFLEALDLFQEAGDILEASSATAGEPYARVLFMLSQTKVKARIHQNFPAGYIKTALQDVQTSNRIREKLPGVVSQSLAEGYFLEGYIHKHFFMRKSQAIICFTKAVSVDPRFVAARRELFDLEVGEDQR